MRQRRLRHLRLSLYRRTIYQTSTVSAQLVRVVAVDVKEFFFIYILFSFVRIEAKQCKVCKQFFQNEDKLAAHEKTHADDQGSQYGLLSLVPKGGDAATDDTAAKKKAEEQIVDDDDWGEVDNLVRCCVCVCVCTC